MNMKLTLSLDTSKSTPYYPGSRIEGVFHIRGLAQRPNKVRAILKGKERMLPYPTSIPGSRLLTKLLLTV